ncbi:MAG TPA: hypothetical protein VGV85_17245, partial [Longimicrobiaceae bacterium]|nr:hypothetical protein [Longimicrobiaceae bacterium]
MARISTLRDDFDDSVHDPARWSVLTYGSLTTIAETNGRVEVAGADNATGTHYAFFISAASFDLTGGAAYVEVAAVLPGPHTDTQFGFDTATGDSLRFYAYNGSLWAQIRVNGGQSDVHLAAYSATAHRWWRLRHDPATSLVHWEVSPDGRSWTGLYGVAAPGALSSVKVFMGAGTWDAQPAGSAVFDNFNVPVPAVVVADRRQQAEDVRVQAASIARNRPHPAHVNNGEESDYPFAANYSKALPHDGCGNVDPAAYGQLLAALRSGDPTEFEAIPLGGMLKLTDPQAGLAFDLEGPDPAAVTIPPAPRIDSPQNSSEAAELYW